MRLSVQLGFLAIANVSLVFIFHWYVITQLGAGAETDAFFASMTIPQLLLVVVSGSLVNVIIPLLSNVDEARRHRETWNFIWLIGGFFCIFAFVLSVTAHWWVPLSVPGFDEEGQRLAISLTRIQLIGMILASITSVQLSVYHAKEQFLRVEISPLLANIFALLLLIWALPRFGVVAAAWISVLRVLIQILFLAPGVGRPCFPDFGSAVLINAWQRIKPLLLGTTYYKTSPLVDRFLLSMAGNGSLSLYHFANQIYSAASQVIIKSMISPIVPVLSKLDAKGDTKGFIASYYGKLLKVFALGLIFMFTLVLFGKTGFDLLLLYGQLSAENIEQLWFIMICLSGMFVGGVAGQVMTSAFYATGDTATVTYMAMITYTINLPVKIASFYYWGIYGLAISTSIYLLVNMLLLMFLMNRKLTAVVKT
jgi:putative peptidoglycan lipid II flippase